MTHETNTHETYTVYCFRYWGERDENGDRIYERQMEAEFSTVNGHDFYDAFAFGCERTSGHSDFLTSFEIEEEVSGEVHEVRDAEA